MPQFRIMEMAMEDLRIKPSSKQILSIAMPITIAILVPQLNLLINTIFLGRLDTVSLGNAGITGVFFLIFSVAGFGLNNAIQSALSKYAGAGKTEYFSIIITQAIRICLQYALVFMLFTWVIGPIILRAVLDPSSVEINISFLKIIVFSLPFLYLFQLGNALLIASLNSKLLLIGFLVQAVLNIVFDYLMIFGTDYFDGLGFNGAAYATIIAEVGAVLVIYLVLLKKGLIKKFTLFSNFQYDKPITRELQNLAVPLMGQYMMSVTTWLIFFILIDDKGALAKAISNTIRNVFGVAGIFVWSFASTCNTMVSNIVGQKKPELIMPLIWKICFWGFAFCSFFIAIINIFPEYFFNLFGQDDVFLQESIPVLRIVSLGLLLMCFANIWINGITGIGHTRVNVLIELVGVIVYLAYTWYVMRIDYTTLARAWTNELVYWITIFFISYLYMHFTLRKKRGEI